MKREERMLEFITQTAMEIACLDLRREKLLAIARGPCCSGYLYHVRFKILAGSVSEILDH